MNRRPGLVAKVLGSTPQEWFGRPLRQVHDADMLRWQACVIAARHLVAQGLL